MTNRTAVGTASLKPSGSTLTISNVSLTSGAALVVGIGYDDAQGHPTSVTWGQRSLKMRPPSASRNPGTYDIAMSVWTVGSVRDTATRDVVITWAGNILERAAVAIELEGANRIDQATGNNEPTGTTTPTTGATSPLSSPGNYALAFFVSEGPSSDTVTSATIDDNGTPVTAGIGQRAGTVGPQPVSNVTIQEVFLELTSPLPTKADLVASDSRLWIAAIITMEPLTFYEKYTARAKDVSGVVMWTTDDESSVASGATILNPDGTGTNLFTPTDAEHEAAVRLERETGPFDKIILVED